MRHCLARFSAAAALGAALLSPLPAVAQTGTPGAAAFTAIDTDGDGSISRAEWDTMIERLPPGMRMALDRAAVDPDARRAAIAADMIARFDADGDGTLDAGELAAGMATLAEERSARWAEMRAEMQAARTGTGWRERGPRPRAERGSSPRQTMGPLRPEFETLDADGDGVISRAEFEAARQNWAERRGPLGRERSRN